MFGAVLPSGFGALWVDQPPAPSRTTSTPPASLPTAVHAPRLEHDTASRLLVVPAVVTAGAIVQLAAAAAAGIDSTTHSITAIRKRPRTPTPSHYARRSANPGCTPLACAL